MKSQNEKIKKHLLSGESITGLEAFYFFDTLNLAQRIYDLKKKGLHIKDKWLKVSKKKKVKEYYVSIDSNLQQ